MDTMQQPRITGYRQLSEQEAALMNEAKALGQVIGDFVQKLRDLPPTPPNTPPQTMAGKPTIDQRWVSIGTTDLQRGLMAVIRGIAQPSTF